MISLCLWKRVTQIIKVILFVFTALVMAEDNDVAMSTAPLLPPHTKQAAKALGILLFFSFLMFSLPFGSFFGTKYLLKDYFGVEGYASTVWSVIAAVLTVNLIIIGYVYVAYHEPEYDEHGNLIKSSESESKSQLNLKQD